MILKHFDLKNNIKKGINLYLLYGPNTGLIEEEINKTFKPAFSKNLYLYDESEILLNQERFKEDIFNKSFFENDKFIIINRSSDKILNLIKEIADTIDDSLKIVIKTAMI